MKIGWETYRGANFHPRADHNDFKNEKYNQ